MPQAIPANRFTSASLGALRSEWYCASAGEVWGPKTRVTESARGVHKLGRIPDPRDLQEDRISALYRVKLLQAVEDKLP